MTIQVVTLFILAFFRLIQPSIETFEENSVNKKRKKISLTRPNHTHCLSTPEKISFLAMSFPGTRENLFFGYVILWYWGFWQGNFLFCWDIKKSSQRLRDAVKTSFAFEFFQTVKMGKLITLPYRQQKKMQRPTPFSPRDDTSGYPLHTCIFSLNPTVNWNFRGKLRE